LLENGKTIKHATSENSKFGSWGSVDNCGSSFSKYLGPAANLGPAAFRISIMDSSPSVNFAPASDLAPAALSSNLAPVAQSANSAASIPLAPAARLVNLAPAARSANLAAWAKSALSANKVRADRKIWHLGQFTSTLAPSAALSANLDPLSIWLCRRLRLQIRIRRQFIEKSAASAIWLHRQFGCIGNSALSANSYPSAS
jgi:hypothetical protein